MERKIKDQFNFEYLDILPGLYYSISVDDLSCISISPKVQQFFGYSKDFILSNKNNFINKIYYEDRMKIISTWQTLNSQPVEIEYRVLTAYGFTKTVKDIIFCPNPNQSPKIINGFIIPKENKEKPIPSKSISFDLRNFLDKNIDTFLYIEPYFDINNNLIDFIIKEVNKSAEKRLGSSRENLIGKNLFLILTLNKKEIGDFYEYKICYEKQVTIQKEFESNDSSDEKGWFYLQLVPTSSGIIVFSREITKWKKNQTELGTTLEFIKSINNSIPGIISLNELQSKDYIYINKSIAQITGYQPIEFFEKGIELFWELVEPMERPKIIQEFQIIQRLFEDESIIDQNKKYILEYTLITKSGEKKRFRNLFTPFMINTDKKRKFMLSIGVDITKEYSSNKQLTNQEKELKDILSNIPDAIIRFSTTQMVIFANKSIFNNLGLEQKEALGKNLSELNLDYFLKILIKEQLQVCLKEKKEINILFDVKIGEDYKYFRGKFIPEFNTSNESIESILVTISDLSKGKINDIEVINAIYHDSLTGLINRNYFLKKLSDYITISQKETLGLGLIFFDVDNFHQINDTLGHSTGDELLKLISEKVPTILSENQLLCRYGGDEFSMIIIGRQENFKTYIASIAIDLMNLFDEPIEIDKNEITVSLSIGISIYPEDGKESLHLLKNAEKATYHIRQKEENSFTFFDHEMGQELIRKNKIIKELRRALDEDEFHLVYQPKIDLKSKTVHGVEALLRWKGNELISPSVFIPIAEESGMIIQIGEWVLSNAIKEISKLYQKGLKFNLAVNLSPKQFSIPRISNLILDMLSMHSFPAEMFEVEITEGTAMKNINQSSEILYDLDNKRINISIDDFGTGYSSLAYLKRFPINYLKIDRTFIKDLPDDKNSLSIVEAIILMAHNLDLKIIAEGVETKAQLQFLESKDCDFIQGYYYSPGLRVTELEEFLLNFQERFP